MDKINLQIVRESFGRVVYSHKCHEKEAEIQNDNARYLKCLNVVLISMTAVPLLANLITDERWLIITGTVFSFFELMLVIFQLSFNPEGKAMKHKMVASELWLLRENYISFIADIMNEKMAPDQIIQTRDTLINKLDSIYKSAPLTSSNAYEKTCKALKRDEEFTFSNQEINQFLPKNLWIKD